jgi:hypothetical protein
MTATIIVVVLLLAVVREYRRSMKIQREFWRRLELSSNEGQCDTYYAQARQKYPFWGLWV